MNEPQRLRHGSDDPFTRALLESARADRAPGGAAQRALLAVSAGMAATAGAGAAAGSASATVAKTGGSLLVKALGVGLLGAAAILAATHERARVSPAPAHPAASPAEVIPPHTPVAVVQTRSTPDPAALPPAPKPRPRRVERAAVPRAAAAVPAAAEDDTLLQLAELGAVRRALAAHAPVEALALLDRFAAHHPRSPLAEEASVLRIDALADAGRTREALTQAAAFLQAHPNSAYARRIRKRLALP